MDTAQTIAASPDVVAREVGGETVLLNLESGTYFGLNPVGGAIWNMIEREPQTIAALTEEVARRFAVEPEVARADIVALVQEMSRNSLLAGTHDA